MENSETSNTYDPNETCKYQASGKGTLECLIAKPNPENYDNAVKEETCERCEIGRIFRETHCPHITGKVILGNREDGSVDAHKIRCEEKKIEETNLVMCRKCKNLPS